MSYSYFFGILPNFSLSFIQWVFLVVFGSVISVFFNFLLLKKKIPYSPIIVNFLYCISTLVAFGIVGFGYIGVLYFVTYALYSDFRKDY